MRILSKEGDVKSNSHFSKISKFIVDAFPRRRLVLSQRLLRKRLSSHILTVVGLIVVGLIVVGFIVVGLIVVGLICCWL